jgi:hypothetical protein
MIAIFDEVMFHIMDDLNDLYDQTSPSSIIQTDKERNVGADIFSAKIEL